MQTFFVYDNYVDTAKVLDDKRLGKQRVEAYQILKALRGDYADTGAWVHHPATVMWRTNPYELALYGLTMSIEFFERGFDGFNMIEIFTDFQKQLRDNNTEQYPWWANNEMLQMTHRSNLIRKYPEYYGGWQVPNNIPYIWPLPEVGQFRLGSFKNGDNLRMFNNGVIYLTSAQVAEHIGRSHKAVLLYKTNGQMPEPDRVDGRTQLWRLDTINKWRDNGYSPNTISDNQ